MIKIVDDISKLLLGGEKDWKKYGNVRAETDGELTIFCYGRKCYYQKKMWNRFEVISRGLIINNQTGEIVARPFDKFWLWGQYGQKTLSPIKSVWEKADGSLGILYRRSGQYRIATKFRFDGEHSRIGTEMISHVPFGSFPEELTLMFEIIYPEDSFKKITSYGSFRGLYLIGGRNRFSGEYIPEEQLDIYAGMYGFERPKKYYNNISIEELLDSLNYLMEYEEGYVVHFEDGSMFKFKGRDYQELFKRLNDITYRKVLDMIESNSLNKFLELIDDSLLDQVQVWISEIEQEFSETKKISLSLFEKIKDSDGREFAEKAKSFGKPMSNYLFLLKRGKSPDKAIYGMMRKRKRDGR